MIAYIQISILCFDITKDENLLKEILFELSGHKKQHWFKNNDGIVSSEQFCLRKNFDPLKKRTELLEIHKGLNLSFEIPEIKFKQEYIYTNNNGSCFIATLCYEDINHRDIVTLRIFRDNHLSDKTIGKIFIFSYYTFGPIFIPIFKKNNNLRRFFKLIVLRNIILIIRKNFF